MQYYEVRDAYLMSSSTWELSYPVYHDVIILCYRWGRGALWRCSWYMWWPMPELWFLFAHLGWLHVRLHPAILWQGLSGASWHLPDWAAMCIRGHLLSRFTYCHMWWLWWRLVYLIAQSFLDLTKARYSHPVRNGYSGLIRGKDGVGEDEGLHPTSDTAYCVEVGCLTTASLHRHWLNDNLLYMYAIILPGHHGQYCQLWLDECSDSPCQNGGVCVLSYDTGYTCDCEEGKHLYSSVIMIATVYSTRCKVSLAFCVIFARINLWLSLVDRVRRW